MTVREKIAELVAHLAEHGLEHCVGNEEICSLCREIVTLYEEHIERKGLSPGPLD